jgi:hypothetical protein
VACDPDGLDLLKDEINPACGEAPDVAARLVPPATTGQALMHPFPEVQLLTPELAASPENW